MCLSANDPHFRNVWSRVIRPHALFLFSPSLSLVQTAAANPGHGTKFLIDDQFRIPLGVQLTEATTSRGLAPKPPESGWYPQRLPLWLDGVSVGKDTQSYEYFSLCYDDPAPGQGWPREGECGLPSLPYGVSIRTRDWHFATSLVCVTKTQCL